TRLARLIIVRGHNEKSTITRLFGEFRQFDGLPSVVRAGPGDRIHVVLIREREDMGENLFFFRFRKSWTLTGRAAGDESSNPGSMLLLHDPVERSEIDLSPCIERRRQRRVNSVHSA